MKSNTKRSLRTGLITFIISVTINVSSNAVLAVSPLSASFVLLFFIVFIGILFDVLGTAAAAGDEIPFHAMASDRVPGAKQSIWLVRNADRVASFCNDIVGDIAGTISGATAAAIVFKLVLLQPSLNEAILNTLLIAFVAALTVGGKAFAKSFAMNHSTDILYLAGRILYAFEKIRLKRHKTDKAKKRK